MGDRRRRPTANRESPEWRKGAAVVLGAPGALGKEKRGKWIECGLLVLLGSRGKEEEQARARDTAATRWRPGAARVGVARAGKARGGGKPGRGRGERRVVVRAAGGGAGEELERR
jgi:hypothetical protein